MNKSAPLMRKKSTSLPKDVQPIGIISFGNILHELSSTIIISTGRLVVLFCADDPCTRPPSVSKIPTDKIIRIKIWGFIDSILSQDRR
jgi:hypothetical protein